jgi:ATP-binding cassette subfamily B (MDR/TAP) protein 1
VRFPLFPSPIPSSSLILCIHWPSSYAQVSYFDKEEHAAGTLTSQIAGWATKVNGLLGMTQSLVIQSIATLICGAIIGLCYAPKVAAVGIACMPLLMSVRLLSLFSYSLYSTVTQLSFSSSGRLLPSQDCRIEGHCQQESVRALGTTCPYSFSSLPPSQADILLCIQACEAAGAIRTVASLTREDDVCLLYANELAAPQKKNDSTSLYGNAVFSFTQSIQYFFLPADASSPLSAMPS